MLTLLFAGGIVLLVAGARLLVGGARHLALRARVSPVVIGLTVVAFGTSMPEFVVSVRAALDGSAELSVGNVVGSNIFNVLFVLGLAASLTPLAVAQQLVRIDVPLMVLISLAIWVLGANGVLGRIEGWLLVAGIVGYTVAAVRSSRRERPIVLHEYTAAFGAAARGQRHLLVNLVTLVLGAAALALGAEWVVRGATALARHLGVSELVIGLTIVAAGTSLPEVATSVVAGLKGERDIAIGNVVGSNIFNLLGVLGTSALVAPAGLRVAPAALQFDVPVMVLAAVVCLPILFTGQIIARWEGLLFLAYYLLYATALVLKATGHVAWGPFATATAILISVTLIPVLLLAWHDARRRHSPPAPVSKPGAPAA